MNDKILLIIDRTIGKEGEYSDHPNDPGKRTRWGVTEAVARNYGYKGSMKDLPRELAVEIYLALYFLEPHFDRVFAISPAIAEELMDTGINCGTGFAKPLLQKALNLLNRQEKDYEDLKEDGDIGKNTIKALSTFLAQRGYLGQTVLLKTLNIMQGARYIEITLANPKLESFYFGWVANRIELGE